MKNITTLLLAAFLITLGGCCSQGRGQVRGQVHGRQYAGSVQFQGGGQSDLRGYTQMRQSTVGQAQEHFYGTVEEIKLHAKKGLSVSVVNAWKQVASDKAICLKKGGLTHEEIDRITSNSARNAGFGDKATAHVIFSQSENGAHKAMP